MTELFAGIAGGVGLVIAGMWLLTENLKTLASWRLRRSASRWTARECPRQASVNVHGRNRGREAVAEGSP